MEKKFKRRKYFIHPSSQLKYIALSTIPALIMSLFCTYFLTNTGELALRVAGEKPLVPFYSIKQTIAALEKEGYTKDTVAQLSRLKGELNSLKKIMEAMYLDTLTEWNKTKRAIFIVVFFVLVSVGLLSLLYSHRIAGPLFRIKRSVDMLSEGKDIPPIRLRKQDEFKDLAESLDRLRNNLKEKGLLESN
jgi:hypothetical protein